MSRFPSQVPGPSGLLSAQSRFVTAGVIPRAGFSNGALVYSGFTMRLRFTFVDVNRTLLAKAGQTVQLTGTLRRGGGNDLLDFCFVVCSLPANQLHYSYSPYYCTQILFNILTGTLRRGGGDDLLDFCFVVRVLSP